MVAGPRPILRMCIALASGTSICVSVRSEGSGETLIRSGRAFDAPRRSWDRRSVHRKQARTNPLQRLQSASTGASRGAAPVVGVATTGSGQVS